MKLKKTGIILFIVKTYRDQITVLGTHFNVNAYTNEEEIRTTLLEGSVVIGNVNASIKLKPGEQAISKESIRVDKNANISAVMAWKNGAFEFQNADVPSVLRQLERWYDIRVIYKDGIPPNKINGRMGRNLKLSQALVVLKGIGLKCKIEGRQLIVNIK